MSRVYNVPSVQHASLTVFAGVTVRRSLHLRKQETRPTDDQFSACLGSEKTVQQDKSWLVIATEKITIAPRCRQIVVGRLESEKGQSLPPLVFLEPTQILIELIFLHVRFHGLNRKHKNLHA